MSERELLFFIASSSSVIVMLMVGWNWVTSVCRRWLLTNTQIDGDTRKLAQEAFTESAGNVGDRQYFEYLLGEYMDSSVDLVPVAAILAGQRLGMEVDSVGDVDLEFAFEKLWKAGSFHEESRGLEVEYYLAGREGLRNFLIEVESLRGFVRR